MSNIMLQLITGTIVGLIAGYVGSYMVLRRMSLVGDALSHVALPGIAIAIMLHVMPLAGALIALIVAIIGVWFFEIKTTLPSETLVGIFFTTALALGLLLTPQPDLLEALFGDISKITSLDLILSIAALIVVVAIMEKISRSVILGILSRDLTQSMGLKLNRDNFLFLLLVSIVITLGIKITGTLLMGSLVIIPAAAAKNIAHHLNHYKLASALIGAMSASVGIALAGFYAISPGPIVVLVSGLVFLSTFAMRRSA